MKRILVFSALIVAVLATACKPGSSPFSPTGRGIIKVNDLKMTVTTRPQGLEALTFLIELTNEGSSPVTLQFGSTQIYDIEVSTSAGATVWNWSHDKAFAQVLCSLDLNPGQSQSYQGQWDFKTNDGSHVPRGTYTARVWITNMSHNPDISVEFELTI
jgi:hypothetical protein